jgi:DNA-binding response OmpR family regulator
MEHCYIGPFDLQPDQRRLLKDGAPVSLRPRAFDLLVALVDRTGQLVTKDKLLLCVWLETVVEKAALHVQVSAQRKAVASDTPRSRMRVSCRKPLPRRLKSRISRRDPCSRQKTGSTGRQGIRKY